MEYCIVGTGKPNASIADYLQTNVGGMLYLSNPNGGQIDLPYSALTSTPEGEGYMAVSGQQEQLKIVERDGKWVLQTSRPLLFT